MRRVMLLALLALALPTAALANTITYTAFGDASTLNINNNPGEGMAFASASVLGPTYDIFFSSGPATACCFPFFETVSFTSGTLEVLNHSTGALLFQTSAAFGNASIFSFTIGGGFENGSFGFQVPGVFGSAFVSVTTVPEPSALEGLLLGTGMLGLAEMTRRKLRLGT